MTVQLGNAGAPRWYDRSQERLADYVAHLRQLGATAAEIVLHHGDADDVTSRVHVLAPDLARTVAQYRAAGMHVHLHAPLTPAFRIAGWATDAATLRAVWAPILDAACTVAAGQQGRTVLVLHAASGTGDDEETLAAFLRWAGAVARERTDRLAFAVELRNAAGPDDTRFDRSRERLLRYVERSSRDDVGICWDLGHDWEGRSAQADWQAVPSDAFLSRVTHVHLHGASADGTVHHPLQAGEAPWEEQLGALLDHGYGGAITMEIRYRFALALGDPWVALAETYRLAQAVIAEHDANGVHRTLATRSR